MPTAPTQAVIDMTLGALAFPRWGEAHQTRDHHGEGGLTCDGFHDGQAAHQLAPGDNIAIAQRRECHDSVWTVLTMVWPVFAKP
jgi:hypothetical protein